MIPLTPSSRLWDIAPSPWPQHTGAHAPALPPFFFQMNNYLTVPAHKVDSPTMSRARIGSGMYGPGGAGNGHLLGYPHPSVVAY